MQIEYTGQKGSWGYFLFPSIQTKHTSHKQFLNRISYLIGIWQQLNF